MHIHRSRAHTHLYELMSPKLQGTVVRQITSHDKFMRSFETQLNKGRGGLFRSGDVVRLELPEGGRNLVTHLPTGMQVERQDFNRPVTQEVRAHATREALFLPPSLPSFPPLHPNPPSLPPLPSQVHVTLDLSQSEMNVGAAIRINLDGTARDTNKAGKHLKSPSSEANAKDDPNDVGFAEFYNVDAISYRRTLQLDGRGLHGLSTRQPTDAPSRWRLPPHGILTVSEPVVSLMSLPPVEEAFLVRVATLLTPLVFAPSELLPIGRMYVVHRGLALLRKRWLGVGAMWGLEMILQEEYTQQYAAAAQAEGSSTHAPLLRSRRRQHPCAPFS